MHPHTGWRRRRWAPAAAPVLVTLAALVGCSTGQDAGTATETPDTPGVDGAVGDVALDDVFLDSDASVPAGASVALRGALSNSAGTADRLVAARTPAASSVQLLGEDGQVSADGIELPADGSVDATTGAARMRLEGVAEPIATTDTVPVTFVFEAAGEVELDVPVGTASP
ncbi:MAG TPA: copper chaperone PCu(A)C [Geodermatophilus sp.]|nr:copper chaperone PCu(A)C [Geodermatophilus sp.]